MLAQDALALVVALVLGHAAEHTSHQAADVRAKIDVARDAGKRLDLRRIAQIEKRLQLARLPVQAVEMPHDHAVNPARAEIAQQALVLGPPLPTPRADVVVDIEVGNDPAALLGEPLAILDLPPHPQLIALPIRRDPRVNPHMRNRRASNHSHRATLADTRMGERVLSPDLRPEAKTGESGLVAGSPAPRRAL